VRRREERQEAQVVGEFWMNWVYVLLYIDIGTVRCSGLASLGIDLGSAAERDTAESTNTLVDRRLLDRRKDVRQMARL